jgi:hypothetical protein
LSASNLASTWRISRTRPPDDHPGHRCHIGFLPTLRPACGDGPCRCGIRSP